MTKVGEYNTLDGTNGGVKIRCIEKDWKAETVRHGAHYSKTVSE